MAKSFSQQVADWQRKANARTEAIFKESVQRTANMANNPIAQGGKLPVDTSFLLNSMAAAIGKPPSGPSNQSEQKGNPSEVIVVLAGAKITDIVYVGWTAEYARPMNVRYGFRDLAAQKWNNTVKQVTEEVKRRIP